MYRREPRKCKNISELDSQGKNFRRTKSVDDEVRRSAKVCVGTPESNDSFRYHRNETAVCRQVRSSNSVLDFVGPYALGRLLKRTLHWKIREGIHNSTGSTVAVRIVKKSQLVHDADLRIAVEREVSALRIACDHVHIIKLHDVLQSSKYLFVITEKIEGYNLLEFVTHKENTVSYARQALLYFLQLLEALHYLHQTARICHRDVKLENIWIDEPTNTLRLTNFTSAASILPAAGHKQKLLNVTCGSKHYACPEILLGESYDGAAADMWSCGVVLYALLSFRLPFTVEDDGELYRLITDVQFDEIPNLPPSLRCVLYGLLCRDPACRMRSDEILQNEFLRMAADENEFYDVE